MAPSHAVAPTFLLISSLTLILGAALMPVASASSYSSSGSYSSGYGSDYGYGSPSTMIDPTVTMVEPDSLGGWVLSKFYWWIIHPFGYIFCHGVRCMFQYSIIPFFELVFGIIADVINFIARVVQFFVQHVVKPADKYFITPVGNAIAYVVPRIFNLVREYARSMYQKSSSTVVGQHVVEQCGSWWLLQILRGVIDFISRCLFAPPFAVGDIFSWIADSVTTLQRNVIEPSFAAIERVLVIRSVTAFLDSWIVTPLSQAEEVLLVLVKRYVLTPLSEALAYVLQAIWRGFVFVAKFIWNYILSPFFSLLGLIYDSLEKWIYPEPAVIAEGKYSLGFSTGELTSDGTTILMPGQAGSKIQMRLRNGESMACNCVIWVNGHKHATVRLHPSYAAYPVELVVPSLETSVVEAVFLPRLLGARLPSHCTLGGYEPGVFEEVAECFAVDEAKAVRLRVLLSTAAPARDEL